LPISNCFLISTYLFIFYVYIFLFYLMSCVFQFCQLPLALLVGLVLFLYFFLFLALPHVVAMSHLRAVVVSVSVAALAAPEVIGSKINRA